MASAHYLIRASDGEIAQLVAESDTAYHARSANYWTIGIEHEFFLRRGILFTEVQYRSSAALVCAITRRYGIPADRAHIVGHNELPFTDHSDPGPTWNWTYYMSLVRACSNQRAETAARGGLRTLADHGHVPAAGLALDDAGDEVALLQWDLAYLGFMAADDVRNGGSTFGPLTLGALVAFQDANGLPATGFYGDLSAAALATSLGAVPPTVPAGELEMGAESDDVALLQTALEQLGYTDFVTGYYGPITSDAVARFQEDNGIDVTGAYGPITRMALASLTR